MTAGEAATAKNVIHYRPYMVHGNYIITPESVKIKLFKAPGNSINILKLEETRRDYDGVHEGHI